MSTSTPGSDRESENAARVRDEATALRDGLEAGTLTPTNVRLAEWTAANLDSIIELAGDELLAGGAVAEEPAANSCTPDYHSAPSGVEHARGSASSSSQELDDAPAEGAGASSAASARHVKRPWAIAVRALAVPVWYPFAAVAWIGERSETIFWWIERQLPSVEKVRRG